jgi:multiple antibiotic resistance protein
LLLWTSFLLAFSALLPLINPLGSALVFLGLVGEAPPISAKIRVRLADVGCGLAR